MEFINTADGSKTLYHEKVGEHYHSKHGALGESEHVFLESGLKFWLDLHHKKNVSVLEVGFGTGLNFLVAADYCTENGVTCHYSGVEIDPLPLELLASSGYQDYVESNVWLSFLETYAQALTESVTLNERVQYGIGVQPIMEYATEERFDVVFFDAFAAIHQPEMWTPETLHHVASLMKPDGVFVTYAITGNLKRAMKALGFVIEKAPGAPGKREMLRAIKRF